jgi:hypothetical protein
MLMPSVAATFGSHRRRAIIASRACSLAAFQSRKDIPKSFFGDFVFAELSSIFAHESLR